MKNPLVNEWKQRALPIRSVVCFFLIGCALLGVGCQSLPEIRLAPVYEHALNTTSTWREVAPGMSRLEDRVAQENVGARFILYRFSSKQFTWKIATSTTPMGKTMLEWADAFPEARLLFNAGYFHGDGLPSGYVVANGSRFGSRAFDANRSNLLTLDPWPVIRPSGAINASSSKEQLQSYPLLIKQGQPLIQKESGLYGRRTFVGTDTEGNTYVGFVPYESISFYQLVHLLQQLPVKWQTVLNLDGGSSTGFVSHSSVFDERVESFSTIPYVIVVEAK